MTSTAPSWLNYKISGILMDISGVLKDGPSPVPGSVNAFERLRRFGIPLRLLTNETQMSRADLSQQLNEFGYKVEIHEIFCPALALSQTLKKEGLRPHLLVHPDVLPDFEDIETSNPNCLVLGDAAEHFTYESLNKAFGFLMGIKEKKFFALGKGKYYKVDNELLLDVGPFTAALEYALDMKAEVIGKPNGSFFKAAIDDLALSSNEVIMIGDDVLFDIGGAQGAGLRGILVRTGKFRPEDEHNEQVTPDGIVDDLAQAVELIIQRIS